MTAHEVIRTDIDGLDMILDGGLRHPRKGALFVVLIGGPGTGKTNLALELTVRMLVGDAPKGAAHLYYSLDQPPQEVQDKLGEDFEFFGVGPASRRVLGTLQTESFSAVANVITPPKSTGQPAADRGERYLVLASLQEAARRSPITGAGPLFEKIDRDIQHLSRSCDLGGQLTPRLVTVDNISLSVFDDGSGVRSSLRTLRDRLGERKMHGIFVVEAPPDDAQRAAFAAAEYAADVIVELNYHVLGEQFKERSIEIAKARHQFYYRGTHHFSIVGRNNNGQIRGGRGTRRPGIHVYPSTSTLMSSLNYREREGREDSGPKERAARETALVALGIDGLEVKELSSNGLISSRALVKTAHAIALRFLLAGPGRGLLISFQQGAEEIISSTLDFIPDLARSDLDERVELFSLEAEYISAGKFLKDVLDDLQKLERNGSRARRVALCGLGHLRWGFPLLHDAKMLIPWLNLFFRRQRLTSLFLESNLSGNLTDVERDSALQDSVDNLFRLEVTDTRELAMQCLRGLSVSLPRGEDRILLSHEARRA